MERKFDGFYVKHDLWTVNGLRPQYRCFLIEIQSLNKDGNGCYARLSHFSKRFGLSTSRCSEIITMLHQKGMITIQRVGKRRFLFVRDDMFDISNTGSENRTNTSENRTNTSENRTNTSENRTNTSENRITLYKDIEKHIVNNESGALNFLLIHYPTRFETYLMNLPSVPSDWYRFCRHFDNQIEIEQLNFDKNLFFRLDNYLSSWVDNEHRRELKVVKSNDLYEAPRYPRLSS